MSKRDREYESSLDDDLEGETSKRQRVDDDALDSLVVDVSGRIGEQLESIASAVMHNHNLIVGGSPWQCVEVEAYLKAPEHPDPFAHGDPEQETHLRWYFHRQNGKGWKGGTYKGLDIALGRSGVVFGLLLRSIRNTATDQVVEGPCKVVDRILSECGKGSIAELVEDPSFSWSCTDTGLLQLQPCSPPDSSTRLWGSPRVGLTLKRRLEHRFDFVMAPLRWTVVPHRLKKNKALLAAALVLQHGLSVSTVVNMGISTESKINAWVSVAQKGQKQGLEAWDGVAATKQADLLTMYGSWLAFHSK